MLKDGTKVKKGKVHSCTGTKAPYRPYGPQGAQRYSSTPSLPRHQKGVKGRHAPAALYPRERPGTHCTGGWVGPRAGLDRCGKSHPHRDSIPGPSSPQPVAIPTTLSGPRWYERLSFFFPDVVTNALSRQQLRDKKKTSVYQNTQQTCRDSIQLPPSRKFRFQPFHRCSVSIYDVILAVTMLLTVCWDVTLWNLVERCRHFRDRCCVQHQDI